MGNEESLAPPESNSKFRNYQLTKNEHNKKMYIKMNIYSESNDITPFLAMQQHRSHIYKAPELFKPQFVKVIHDGLCNDSCTAVFTEQAYVDTLFDQIAHRQAINRFYSHQQMWYLLLIVAKTVASVYQSEDGKIVNHRMIGNIHPRNILLDQNGSIKIVSINSLPYQKNHFVSYCDDGIDYGYISPESLGFTYKSRKNRGHKFPDCLSPQKSQAFTLGMTMLAMGCITNNLTQVYDTSFYFQFSLGDSSMRNSIFTKIPQKIDDHSFQGIYSSQQYKKQNKHHSNHSKSTIQEPHSYAPLLNRTFLDKLLNNIRNRYCFLLGDVIHNLLNPDPNNRMTIVKLYNELLKPNQGYILGMSLMWLPQNQSYDLRQLTEQEESRRSSIKEFNSQYL